MIVQANARLAISVSAKYCEDTNEVLLQSIVLPLAFVDTITVEKLHPNFMDMVHYSNHTFYVRDKSIIHEVISKMRAKYKIKDNFDISIHKNIPTGHGLGSGASAAMSVIKTINKLAKLNLNEKELLEVALEAKQDVAYFLTNKPALFNHQNQRATILTLKQKIYVLLLMHPSIVERKEVINGFLKNPSATNPNIDDVVSVINNGNLKELGQVLFNDLSPIVLTKVPALQASLNYLAKTKVLASGIGGSGAVVFAISEDKYLLKDIADKYKKENYDTLICKVFEQEERR